MSEQQKDVELQEEHSQHRKDVEFKEDDQIEQHEDQNEEQESKTQNDGHNRKEEDKREEDDQNDIESKANLNEDVEFNEDQPEGVEANDGELNDQELNTDAYSYLKLDEYTSERFKIEIQNIYKFATHADLKKLFKNKFNLTLKKTKIVKGKKKGSLNHAYVALSNEEEREKAIALADGFCYKGSKLRVIKAKPVADPRVRNQYNNDKREKVNYDELSEDALQQLLFNQVCPLWKQDYNCQLQEKQNTHRQLLANSLKEIQNLHVHNQNTGSNTFKSANYDRGAYLAKHRKLDDLYNGIKHATDGLQNNYRNKCEFTICKNDSDGRAVVGFRLGSYSDNKTKVAKPLNCPLLNEKMIKMIDLFEQFINGETCELQPFDMFSHEGHLKQITIRTTQLGCMLIVALNRTGLGDEQLQAEIGKLKQFIQSQASALCTSVYVQFGQIQLGESKTSDLLEHVDGDLYLLERMRNDELQFRISPFAFFQINVNACEILYDTVSNLANLSQNSILLDVCSGVGTIGIFLANRVKHVLAVELNKEAVEDAIYNAEFNQVKNIEFFTGYAEDNLPKMIQKAKRIGRNCEIVAILDPPRAGLKNNIIKAIRNCNEIAKLIYVSCEPKLSRQNLIDLCRPPSKAYLGMPFNMAQAVSVDMFPHTAQCELVTLFTRDTFVGLKASTADVNCKEDDVKIDELAPNDRVNSDVCHSADDRTVDSGIGKELDCNTASMDGQIKEEPMM